MTAERVTAATAAIGTPAPARDLAEFEPLEAHLIAEFTPPLRPEEVQRCLVACVTKYQSATVRTYLYVLIEREARGRLRALCETHH